MRIDQTQLSQLRRGRLAAARWRMQWIAGIALHKAIVGRLVVLLLALFLLGGSALPAGQVRTRTFAMVVAGSGFNLLAWEAQALWDKAVALVQQPAAGLGPEESVTLVKSYLARAARISELEQQLARLASQGTPLDNEETQAILAELEVLRARQAEDRPAVEQVIQDQVGWVLVEQGFGAGPYPAPPVQFTFTEPPKKLVVSPRDRIDIIYSRMLSAEMSLGQIEAAERRIAQQDNAVGYITEIGGLGAYPTMVIDRASLRWVLSTVAHEWVHNYLVFFPLGWNYFASQELTTINETVAEIAGNEIGDRVLSLYYPEVARVELAQDELAEETQTPAEPPFPGEPPAFDFQVEMRKTRLEVDRLLAEGKVAEAEDYMEQRRRFFVENGYPLRVLNQAYFAFHGSYGTSPASTSPIGPKLEQLRTLMPDLETFLSTVRWFTSVDDLDQALGEWEAAARTAAELLTVGY